LCCTEEDPIQQLLREAAELEAEEGPEESTPTESEPSGETLDSSDTDTEAEEVENPPSEQEKAPETTPAPARKRARRDLPAGAKAVKKLLAPRKPRAKKNTPAVAHVPVSPPPPSDKERIKKLECLTAAQSQRIRELEASKVSLQNQLQLAEERVKAAAEKARAEKLVADKAKLEVQLRVKQATRQVTDEFNQRKTEWEKAAWDRGYQWCLRELAIKQAATTTVRPNNSAWAAWRVSKKRERAEQV
jgi:hypothetical protein